LNSEGYHKAAENMTSQNYRWPIVSQNLQNLTSNQLHNNSQDGRFDRTERLTVSCYNNPPPLKLRQELVLDQNPIIYSAIYDNKYEIERCANEANNWNPQGIIPPSIKQERSLREREQLHQTEEKDKAKQSEVEIREGYEVIFNAISKNSEQSKQNH